MRVGERERESSAASVEFVSARWEIEKETWGHKSQTINISHSEKDQSREKREYTHEEEKRIKLAFDRAKEQEKKTKEEYEQMPKYKKLMLRSS